MAAVPDEDPSARAEESAEQWLEAIERTLKRHEIDALKQWLSVPLHRKVIVDRCRLWHGPDILAVLAELIPVESLSRRVERNYGRVTLALFLAVSGLGFVTILIAVSKWWPDPNRPANPLRAEQSFQTPLGARRTIRLPDGGVMTLNTSTHVIVSYGPRFRDVTLVRGEAEFRVVSDAERAFRVHAGPRQVVSEQDESQFMLRRLAQDDLVLTVVRGRISVPAGRSRVPPSPSLLRARVSVGDHVFAAAEGGLLGPAWQITRSLTAQELEERIAWRSGLMIFSNEPLEDALAEVERYTPARFIFSDPKLRTLRLDAQVRIGEIPDLLRALHESFAIESRIRADGTIELSHATNSPTIPSAVL